MFIQNRVGSQNIRNTWYTKGCLVLYHNKLAYTNRHRIKINVLTARQTYRLEYLYTGELNMLRGSRDVRKD